MPAREGFARAKHHAPRALALEPNYTFGRMPYAICLMSGGRFRDAERQLLAARELDPLSPAPSNLLGRLYVQIRRRDRAIEPAFRPMHDDPRWPPLIRRMRFEQ